jgi:hypothetical protein
VFGNGGAGGAGGNGDPAFTINGGNAGAGAHLTRRHSVGFTAPNICRALLSLIAIPLPLAAFLRQRFGLCSATA